MKNNAKLLRVSHCLSDLQLPTDSRRSREDVYFWFEQLLHKFSSTFCRTMAGMQLRRKPKSTERMLNTRRSVKDQQLWKADIRGPDSCEVLKSMIITNSSTHFNAGQWMQLGMILHGGKQDAQSKTLLIFCGPRGDDWGQVWIAGSKSWQPRFGTRGNFHYSGGWVAHAGPPPRPWDSACPFSQQHHSCPTRPDLQGQAFTCHRRNFLALSGCSKISQVPPIKTKVGSLNPKRPWSTTRFREIFYCTVFYVGCFFIKVYS